MAFGGFNNASRFCDCFLFFLFLPYLSKTNSATPTKILIITVTIFTIMNTILTIATQAVLGVGFAKTLKFPYFTSIQQINVFDIIQRIEFFNVIAWIIIFFFKLSSSFLAASMIMSQAFKTKSYKPFVIPMNLVIAGIALFTTISYHAILKMIFKDIAYLVIFAMNFVIPFIVLMIYLFRRKSLKNVR
jgi:spore germination protein KB